VHVPRFDVKTTEPAKQPADLLIAPVFEGPEAGPGARELGDAVGIDLVRLLKENQMRGKVGETFTLPTLGRATASTVLLVGVGKRSEVGGDTIRRAAGKVAARASRFRKVAALVAQAGPAWDEAVQSFVEGLLLGAYRFDRYKAEDDNGDRARWQSVTILANDGDVATARDAIRRGEILAEAAMWARDLVNIPALDATPAFLADEAKKMAKENGLTCKIWTKAELDRGGFGGILGVGRGSENDPRMIELRYDGGGGGKPLALTGKGITFDSGGLSIKDAKNMEWMKSDMAGAATILAAMRAIAQLGPAVDVIAAIPSAENLPSASSIRPGDVLRHRGGTTSEVLNTDAEGRLVLADALAYLAEQDPRLIVDAATLTGACMIALGDELWGVMGNDRDVIRGLLDAGEAEGEPGWELPLWQSYRKQIDSNIADVKNIGNRYGGAITAALFLKEFVGEVPWAHMDIAGVAFAERPGDYWPKGATGNPVRTIVRFVQQHAGAKREGRPTQKRSTAKRQAAAKRSGSRRKTAARSTRSAG
jgi:leucyl aminopeptidase